MAAVFSAASAGVRVRNLTAPDEASISHAVGGPLGRLRAVTGVGSVADTSRTTRGPGPVPSGIWPGCNSLISGEPVGSRSAEFMACLIDCEMWAAASRADPQEQVGPPPWPSETVESEEVLPVVVQTP